MLNRAMFLNYDQRNVARRLWSGQVRTAGEIIDPAKVCPQATDPSLKINAKEVCTLLVVDP